jgi:short-subunit dehydrogenase involved in D-alanine esterification of teichoic acids
VDLKLAGRRTLVSGSSSGIGEGIARMLAKEGCAVVVHGRNRERAEKVAADINAAGVAIGELSTDENAAAIHDQARAALGGNIEILVNNAGGSSTGNTTKTPIEIGTADWISNYHVNTLAAVRLCRLAVPDMVAAKFGRVINVSSAVAVQPNNMGADYSGAKSALNNFGRRGSRRAQAFPWSPLDRTTRRHRCAGSLRRQAGRCHSSRFGCRSAPRFGATLMGGQLRANTDSVAAHRDEVHDARARSLNYSDGYTLARGDRVLDCCRDVVRKKAAGCKFSGVSFPGLPRLMLGGRR